MSYVDSRQGPSFGSMAAVVAIHGAAGVALIFGLTVSGVIPAEDLPIPTFEVKKKPPPPEPPRPQPEPAVDRKVVTPMPPIPIPMPQPTLDSTRELLPPPPQPMPNPGMGESLLKPTPTPVPSFDLVAARPRNDPQKWVTTDDYRSNWIRQEMTGRARFRLEIAADGRVTRCAITSSSGHAALDDATCALVSKRARFQPARGSDGGAVPGTYASTIDWRLPE